MRNFCRYIAIVLFILPIAAFAADQPQFVVGKDYEIITPNKTLPNDDSNANGKIVVEEFFSYGCPFCFRLEPQLEKWLANKPANVEFKRVPVVFESGWDVYAKAYYTAEALGVTDKMTPAIFNAIHNQGQNLNDAAAMETFFIKQGVSKQDFDSAFNFSPSIGMELNRGTQLMQSYQVLVIPTFVVAGKYKTNAQLVNGDNTRLLQIVDFLINKAANPQK